MEEKIYCPECGAVMVEWQGQIDETPQGGAIYGYSYHCHECGYESEVQKIDWTEDDELDNMPRTWEANE